jgi:hypothetical protein
LAAVLAADVALVGDGMQGDISRSLRIISVKAFTQQGT